MAFRSPAPKRCLMMGLAVASALAGTVGGASAQYYLYEDAPRYLEPRYGYGYRDRYLEPRPPALQPRSISRIAAREYGLASIERVLRTGASYVVDGRTQDGARLRLILDPFSGALLDEIVLQGPARNAPRVARIDPQDNLRPSQPRILPLPPERPPALRPPGQANAPATAVPPSPAAPPHPEPAPVEKPPAAATAPATEIPSSPAAPPRPEPVPPTEKPPAAATAPATEMPPSPAAPAPGSSDRDKPRVINPEDVRNIDPADPQPPLARGAAGPAKDEAAKPAPTTEGPAKEPTAEDRNGNDVRVIPIPKPE
ncbi:hypothetical protein ASE63_10370 [Bosea sp. Root381]|uniref:hypothetical protein n=1 Tax=Bosea sp. Root381 TaxID=1736524 RepID=UPI0006FDF087|nr:hypothetical protein [Bosea sp. Root381]KRD99914.1 hypothetical protein ASE63_10370 [Bosea sp. Root381]